MNVADAGALAEGNLAGIGLLLGAEDGEEGGLAGAVGTDEADAIPVVDGEGEVIEQGSGAEAFGDVLRDEDRRHVFSLGERGRTSTPEEGEGTGRADACPGVERVGVELCASRYTLSAYSEIPRRRVKRMIRQLGCCTLAALLVVPVAFAQKPDHDKADMKAQAADEAPAKSPGAMPADSITEGSVTVDGQAIQYKAVAGMLTVGSSDAPDAMLGMDGTYLPGAEIDLG